MSLSKDAILSAADVKVAEVQVPEWGGSLFVRPMTGAEREVFDDSIGKDAKHMRLRLVLLSACDAAGVRLFAEADLPKLAEKSAAALERVAKAALVANGLVSAEANEKN